VHNGGQQLGALLDIRSSLRTPAAAQQANAHAAVRSSRGFVPSQSSGGRARRLTS
jgi:hypothetical protein